MQWNGTKIHLIGNILERCAWKLYLVYKGCAKLLAEALVSCEIFEVLCTSFNESRTTIKKGIDHAMSSDTHQSNNVQLKLQ